MNGKENNKPSLNPSIIRTEYDFATEKPWAKCYTANGETRQCVIDSENPSGIGDPDACVLLRKKLNERNTSPDEQF